MHVSLNSNEPNSLRIVGPYPKEEEEKEEEKCMQYLINNQICCVIFCMQFNSDMMFKVYSALG